MKQFLALLLTFAGCCPCESDGIENASGGDPEANPCPVYCGSPLPADAVSERCAVAFGESFAVPRQCPAGLVPDGCASYTDYSVGFVTACPGDEVSQNVLCCEE
jgi:hypothetical protein